MGSYVFPVDAVSGAPSYTGKMARLTLGAAFSKNTARPVGARSGIHPATPDSVFSVAGTTWTVQPHTGVLDTEASATNGPYGYAFDTNQTGSVNAADATNPRWDLLSVQLSDPAAGDGTSTPGVAIVYTAGTAAASPSLPATPARSLALAQITVPQSGGGSSSVTVLAPYMSSTSGIIRCRTSAEYPSTPYVGQWVDDASLGAQLRWNGSAWKVVPKPRVGVTVALSDAWATASTRTHAGTWAYQEAVGGFTAGATTGNSTPIIVPTGLGGLYAVAMTCGDLSGTSITTVSLATLRVNGSFGGVRADYTAEVVTGRSAVATSAAVVQIADAGTVQLITSLTPASSNFQATLTCYRVSD